MPCSPGCASATHRPSGHSQRRELGALRAHRPLPPQPPPEGAHAGPPTGQEGACSLSLTRKPSRADLLAMGQGLDVLGPGGQSAPLPRVSQVGRRQEGAHCLHEPLHTAPRGYVKANITFSGATGSLCSFPVSTVLFPDARAKITYPGTFSGHARASLPILSDYSHGARPPVESSGHSPSPCVSVTLIT